MSVIEGSARIFLELLSFILLWTTNCLGNGGDFTPNGPLQATRSLVNGRTTQNSLWHLRMRFVGVVR